MYGVCVYVWCVCVCVVCVCVCGLTLPMLCQQCLRNIQNEKTNLVKECPLLKHVSSSVVGKLAEAITWDTQREGQGRRRCG